MYGLRLKKMDHLDIVYKREFVYALSDVYRSLLSNRIFIERLKYVSFGVKALSVKIVDLCGVIPCSLVDANISEEPAATVVKIEESEYFYTLCTLCFIVLGCLNHEDNVAHILATGQHMQHFCLKHCEI